MTEKQYDVIYEKEPRGQVVTDDGIPCTARTCCTRLNRLTEENKELETFKERVFEVIDNHILEETDLRKECIENGSHYTANISRNIIDTLKLIKKELCG